MDRVLLTTKDDFSHEHILAVVKKEYFAVLVKDFCSPESLKRAQEELSSYRAREQSTVDSDFWRLGFPYSEITDEATRRKYHDEAQPSMARLRKIFAPYASPEDELRLTLDERWPSGAELMRVNGEKCFVGVARFQGNNVDLVPHSDRVERFLPEGYQARLQAQLSTNIYVDIPDVGGELEMWDIELDEEEYQRRVGDRAYGIDRAELPEPTVVVKPEPGDLALLNPRLIHAVRPSSDATRITIGSFIGYLGEDRPLVYWS
ncbi:hypothetical protein ACIP93_24375 [Streptomyces sp. NPDC088745]|uniref:2OG-Fe(II)-dependent halogenase WelO5 family protein n=1 Tax=Streptomyces sp. NPDC088745 TaxID=3365884 RepID=UPI003813ECF8